MLRVTTENAFGISEARSLIAEERISAREAARDSETIGRAQRSRWGGGSLAVQGKDDSNKVVIYKPKTKKDFKTIKEGYTYLKKNDLVVDADTLSKGVAAGTGQFAPTLMKSMGQKGGGGLTVPVNITVGEINGDADDFMRRIGPALEQHMERFYYNKMKNR